MMYQGHDHDDASSLLSNGNQTTARRRRRNQPASSSMSNRSIKNEIKSSIHQSSSALVVLSVLLTISSLQEPFHFHGTPLMIGVQALSSSSTTWDNRHFPPPCHALTTQSGLPVCRYALGGAARSQQPASLPASYYNHLVSNDIADAEHNNNNDHSPPNPKFPHGAPFLFYYNPHRYPDFMSGIRQLCNCSETTSRNDLYVASGGTARGPAAMEQRLHDALAQCGGDYLDLFVLEYVCPEELVTVTEEDNQQQHRQEPGPALRAAIQQALEWKRQGRIRHVAASTHSHVVGAVLASFTITERNTRDTTTTTTTTTTETATTTDTPATRPTLDALMLRYNMAHKAAAETISFPACHQNNIPVIAFTTTRWNALQNGHDQWQQHPPPTTGDCLSFALADSVVQIVLHSARDESELTTALGTFRGDMTQEQVQQWRRYGDLDWNDDGFDEYPEERLLVSS